ncbi:hypothetical protein KAU11_03510 [Candidatus Babeliales bacterium]|nr:hypothetical protein [Candidatus Babeliales bacterium]
MKKLTTLFLVFSACGAFLNVIGQTRKTVKAKEEKKPLIEKPKASISELREKLDNLKKEVKKTEREVQKSIQP